MNASKRQITGKVAAILNKRELVMNIGRDDGVDLGQRYAVLNPKAVAIRDPDTGALLGDVPTVKTVVKVVRVDGPHHSTARTFRTIPGKPGIADMLSWSSGMGGSSSRPETLALDPDDERAELDEEKSYVKVGDPVIQALGDEYDVY